MTQVWIKPLLPSWAVGLGTLFATGSITYSAVMFLVVGILMIAKVWKERENE